MLNIIKDIDINNNGIYNKLLHQSEKDKNGNNMIDKYFYRVKKCNNYHKQLKLNMNYGNSNVEKQNESMIKDAINNDRLKKKQRMN